MQTYNKRKVVDDVSLSNRGEVVGYLDQMEVGKYDILYDNGYD